MDEYNMEDDSYYETDIEDLPDNQLSRNVSTDLSGLNEEIEDTVNFRDEPEKSSKTTAFNTVSDIAKDFIIIFITVFIFTNKNIVGSIMNTSMFVTYKKTMVFNVIIGLLIATVVIVIKKLLEYFGKC